MPTLKDVSINITTLSGAPLAEFGLQTLSKFNRVSCFIESVTDLPFCISVSPSIPFPALTRAAEQAVQASSSGSSSHFGEGFGETYRPNYPSASYDPRRSSDGAPWHLLASLRLDGRKTLEKRSIVWLNPENERFDPVVVMKSRLAYDEAGEIRESGWVFREVGIEDLLGVMGLQGQEVAVEEAKGEEGLAKAFEGLGKDRLGDKMEKKDKGKIEVTLERVRVKGVKRGGWKPNMPAHSTSTSTTDNHQAADDDTSLNGLAHLTSSSRPTGEPYEEIDAIEYTCVDGPDAKPWATFTFFYRGKETMAKMGFPGFAVNAEAPMKTEKGIEAGKKLVGGKRERQEDADGLEERRGFGMGGMDAAEGGETTVDEENEEL